MSSGYDPYSYSSTGHMSDDPHNAYHTDDDRMMMNDAYYQNPYDNNDGMMIHHHHNNNNNNNNNNPMNDHNNEFMDDDPDGSNGVGDIMGVDDEIIDFDNDPEISKLPRIIMMGPRRGGKTSIQRVVFHKMSPHETLFRLEPTQRLERSVVDHTPLCRFTIWDFPGDYYGPVHENQYPQQPQQQQQQQQFQQSRMTRQLPVHGNGNNINNVQQIPSLYNDQPEEQQEEIDEGDLYVFGKATALIFVLDAQDEPYDHVLQHFTETVKRAARANPHIAIEVFINKVDGELFLSDEAKYDCRRDVMQQVTDELADAGVMPDSVPISYHLTSIYDHSVFEAFSRVVQKLIPNLQPTLENLLNVLVSTCAMEKAYLFDVASKLYISTDSSPVDMQSVELCSDMIDCVLDVSGIYGLTGGSTEEGVENHDEENDIRQDRDIDSSKLQSGSLISPDAEDSMVNNGGDGVKTVGSDDFAHDILDYGHDSTDELVGTLISQNGGDLVDEEAKAKEVDADSAYDSESESVIRLSKGMVSISQLCICLL